MNAGGDTRGQGEFRGIIRAGDGTNLWMASLARV